MRRKREVKASLIAGLFFLSLGGWLLHMRIHPADRNASNYVPYLAGLVSVFCVPVLFWFRPSMVWGYLINGFTVIIGTITMAQVSVVHFQGQATVGNILLNTTVADIAILWAKFAMGQAVFNLEFLKSDTDVLAHGRFFRYPNMGWWWVHVIGFSAVYAVGSIFWK